MIARIVSSSQQGSQAVFDNHADQAAEVFRRSLPADQASQLTDMAISFDETHITVYWNGPHTTAMQTAIEQSSVPIQVVDVPFTLDALMQAESLISHLANGNATGFMPKTIGPSPDYQSMLVTVSSADVAVAQDYFASATYNTAAAKLPIQIPVIVQDDGGRNNYQFRDSSGPHPISPTNDTPAAETRTSSVAPPSGVAEGRGYDLEAYRGAGYIDITGGGLRQDQKPDCSLGVAVVLNYGQGAYAGTTARHCTNGNGGTAYTLRPSVVGTITQGDIDTDTSIVKDKSFVPALFTGRVQQEGGAYGNSYPDNYSGSNQYKPVFSDGDPVVGHSVCADGAYTGFTCYALKVTRTNFMATVDGRLRGPGFSVEINGNVSPARAIGIAGPGDSGSPVVQQVTQADGDPGLRVNGLLAGGNLNEEGPLRPCPNPSDNRLCDSDDFYINISAVEKSLHVNVFHAQ
jgi:hypothetical protein